ncbi:Blp family class II bacteriocin [Weissella fangxianensis]|uniref:Blp family class II bacteriocin n=1 Tax=Weissella fangxianensis TaxID=2953879 RepID=UPI002157607F|nr:Blp family class II bacteriocin [Weissella fangxianensis]
MKEQYKELTQQETMFVIGGKKKNVAKCYAGTLGHALVGSVAGPVGYWGGALIGYAKYCH